MKPLSYRDLPTLIGLIDFGFGLQMNTLGTGLNYKLFPRSPPVLGKHFLPGSLSYILFIKFYSFLKINYS